MPIENDPSSRMQIRSAGDLQIPAACSVCGNPYCEEGYLDFGCFVEFHGVVYFCMTCLTQAAETAGMFTAEQVGHLTKQIETLLSANELLTSELANANERNAHLSGVLASQFSIDSVPSENSDKDTTEPVKTADSGKPEVKEPTVSKIPARTGGPKLHDITFD